MTGRERRLVIVAIDAATRRRLDAHRECSRCRRELVADEFPARRPWCKTCEATRVREHRAARKAAA
jgi:hypothetical protein